MRIIIFSFVWLLLVITGNASPTIFWSGQRNIHFGTVPGQPSQGSVNLDLNNDGYMDYRFVWNTSTALNVIPQDDLDGLMNEVTTEFSYGNLGCWPLDAGVLIGDALPDDIVWDGNSYTLAEWMVLLENTTQEIVGGGTWFGADEMFMGLRFNDADGIHYGWVRMSVSSEYAGATIHDWAYNTVPGEGLVTSVVPEPSTIALFIVGILTFGMQRIKQYKSKE